VVIRAGDFFGAGSGSWMDLVITKSLRQGKLAACRYFFRHDLPKVAAWLRVVETRDDTCRTMHESWF